MDSFNSIVGYNSNGGWIEGLLCQVYNLGGLMSFLFFSCPHNCPQKRFLSMKPPSPTFFLFKIVYPYDVLQDSKQ